MLDSGANNYLVHVEPSQETEKWEDTLFLAWGTCRCNSIQGPKGIPTTQVEKTGENDESLLPLGWLWHRGCEYAIGSPYFITPKGNKIEVKMFYDLP